MFKKLEWVLNSLPKDLVESVLEGLGVKVHCSEEDPSLVCLHYVASAPKNNSLTNLCRGVVMQVSPEGEWGLVSAAFPRFFNLGEVEGNGGFDFSSFLVEEKWDGTFTTMYFHNGAWRVSTRRAPLGGDFAPLYWEAFHKNGLKLEDHDPNLVYVRELITPENPVVVDYRDQWLLKDIAMVSRETWEEVPLNAALSLPSDLESLRDSLLETSGKEREGFILKDNKGNRLKLKSPNYVALHRAVNNQSPDLRELWLRGDLDEFLLFFPSYKGKADRMLESIQHAVREAAWLVEQFQGDFKEFALVYRKHPCFHPAIMFLRNQTPIIETIRKMPQSQFKQRFL
jgi:hypothetical protein